MNNYIRICTPELPELGQLLSERDDLTYDTFGTVLAIVFDACATVTASGGDVPPELDYSQGLGGADYQEVVEGYNDMQLLHDATPEQQRAVLLHLNAIYTQLVANGESY